MIIQSVLGQAAGHEGRRVISPTWDGPWKSSQCGARTCLLPPEGCPASSPRARHCQWALHLQHGCPQGGLQAFGETSPFLLPSGDLTSSHLHLCPPSAAHARQPGQLLGTPPNPTTPSGHTVTGFPDTTLQMFPLHLVKPAAITTTGTQGMQTCEQEHPTSISYASKILIDAGDSSPTSCIHQTGEPTHALSL